MAPFRQLSWIATWQRPLAAAVAVFLLFLNNAAVVSAQCETGPVTDELPPPLLPSNTQSITIWMEVSFERQTYVVKEVYDSSTRRSLLEYVDADRHTVENVLVNWNENSSYLLHYNDRVCAGSPLSDQDEVNNFYNSIPIMKALMVESMPTYGEGGRGGFIGPAMFFEDFVQKRNGWAAGKQASCDNDRLLPCDHYVQCGGFGGKNKYDFYFSQKEYEMFDRRESLPLYMSYKESVTVDVMSIRVSNESTNLLAPIGLGCQLPTNVPVTIPKVDSFEFSAEVVLDSVELNDTYVSALTGLWMPSFGKDHDHGQEHDHDGLPGLYSFTYSTWVPANEQKTKFKAGQRERIIYDTDHSIFFLQVFKADSDLQGVYVKRCEKQFKDKNYVPTLPLPVGDIKLESLFLQPPNASDSVYITNLGPHQTRGIDTTVYEVGYKDYYIDSRSQAAYPKFVVTYHFAGVAPLLTPVEIQINAFRQDNVTASLTKAFTLTFHVAAGETFVSNANEKLSVVECYDSPDKSDYRWFQVGFFLQDSTQLPELLGSQHVIKEAFLMELYDRYDLLPMRVPEVSVDFVDEQIRVNVLLLENPTLESHFDVVSSKDIKQPTKQLGIKSVKACQAACLAMDDSDCTAVAYCGATCAATNASEPRAQINTRDDVFCSLYVRQKDHHVPVSDVVMANIKQHVNSKSLKERLTVNLSVGKLKVTLISDSYDDTKDFESAFHFQKKKVPVLETAFQIAKAQARFTEGGQNGAKKLGSFSIEDCAVACRNRPDCETFSYCDNSGDCVISPSHAIADDATTDDHFCIVYQAKYVDRFDHHPGLTIKTTGMREVQVQNVDSCADQCLKDSGCKSFDFCQVTMSCVIHSTHITETAGDADAKPECAHFSKSFLFDYSKRQGMQGAEGDVLMVMTNETEAACAKRCTEWSDPETPCLSFDFCGRLNSNEGQCTLRAMSGQGKVVAAPVCDFYAFTAPQPFVRTVHGAGAAFGMSILMICIGIGVGIAGVVGYNKYRG